MQFQISYQKSFLISILLLGVIYVTAIIDLPSTTHMLITLLSYVIFLIFGFKFKKTYILNNLFQLKLQYIPTIIIIVCGFFLINISLSNIAYSILNIEYITEDRTINILHLFSVLLFYPIVEELFYRKFILEGLYNQYGFNKSLFVSSTIFAMLHIFSGNGIFLVFLGGLVFGYVYLKTSSFLCSFITHSGSNLLVLFVSPIILDNYILNIDINKHLYLWILLFFIGLILIIISWFYLKFINDREKKK